MYKVVVALLLSASALHAQTRPNIVLIYSDDHAAHAVSAYQKHLAYAFPLPATPHLDRMAREGMLFTNAFVTNSICVPARAAVLTGQYGHLTGVMTNFDSLHATAVTFPKLLTAAGYATAVIGKWHLKDRPSGFTHYEIMPGQGSYYNPVLMSETDSSRHHGYAQQVIETRAMQWAKAQTRPFFLMLNYNAPHRPWGPGPDQLSLYRDHDLAEAPTLFDEGKNRVFKTTDPEMTIELDLVARDLKLVEPTDMNAAQLAEWRKWYDPENAAFASANLAGRALVKWKYQRFIKDYMRAVQGVDASVGRVLAQLPPNTVVIYSSDQGFFLGDHGWFDKRFMYEESLRTPLIVRWPGVVKRGSVNRDLVMNLDFAQTLLDIAGVKAPATMQGISFAPQLRGRKGNRRDAIYYQYFAYPDWHMVRRQYGVRDARYKLIHYYEIGRWELFDLKKDPHELRNVYEQPDYASVVKDMERKLARLRAEYRVPHGDPSPYRNWQAPEGYRRHH